MKRIMILLLAVLLLGQAALASDADAAIDAVPDGVRVLAGLGKNVALLADETLFRAGDAASDWLAVALALSGAAADYDGYRMRLEAYVTECYRQQGGLHRVKATEYHRTALCVMALGGDPRAFGQKADGTAVDLIADGTYDFAGELGAQGLNAWIFALLTLDAGAFDVPADACYDRAAMRTAILDAQNEDGGFGLTGDGSDVDITAMALQALAPYAALCGDAVERALRYLAGRMDAQALYSSYGAENAESTAQVLLALCALGIDAREDTRFVRGRRSLVEGLLSFRRPDGSFAHRLEDENGDVLATGQALMALTAWRGLPNGHGKLYDMTNWNGPENAAQPSVWLVGAGGVTLLAVGAAVWVRRRKNAGSDN